MLCSTASLTIEDVVAVAYAGPGEITLSLSGEALRKVARARAAVERFLSEERVVYGITTGFGAFKDRLIPPDQVAQLQRNIVMSHATGVGPPFETPVVRAMMLIRANTPPRDFRTAGDALLLRMIGAAHPVVSSRVAGRRHLASCYTSLRHDRVGRVEFGGGSSMRCCARRAGLRGVSCGKVINRTALMAAGRWHWWRGTPPRRWRGAQPGAAARLGRSTSAFTPRTAPD
jgi:hypothetical protein